MAWRLPEFLLIAWVTVSLWACSGVPYEANDRIADNVDALEKRASVLDSNLKQLAREVRSTHEALVNAQALAQLDREDLASSSETTRLLAEDAVRQLANLLESHRELQQETSWLREQLANHPQVDVSAKDLVELESRLLAAMATLRGQETNGRSDPELVEALAGALENAQPGGRPANTLTGLPIILSALIGFFGATIGKYSLDRRRDRLRSEDETRLLAGELHAELASTWRRLVRSQTKFAEDLEYAKAEEDKRVIIRKWEWETRRVPAMLVFEARIGQLARLGTEIASQLIQLHGRLHHLDATLVAARDDSIDNPDERYEEGSIKSYVDYEDSLLRNIEGLNKRLADLANASPHDWDDIRQDLFCSKV